MFHNIAIFFLFIYFLVFLQINAALRRIKT